MDTQNTKDKDKVVMRAEEKKETSCLNNNSLIPAIKESERFISYLINRFKLELPNNYIVVINKTTKSALGTFANPLTKQHFTNTTQELMTITLNTLHLKTCNPYEVLAHELAHFINESKGIKDCSSNQYHNKQFKVTAEQLLLTTEKTKKGYTTKDNEQFNNMVKNDFKAHYEVFNVFQNQKEAKKTGSRLRLYVCSCGIKLRVAKDDLKALCLECNSEFKRVML